MRHPDRATWLLCCVMVSGVFAQTTPDLEKLGFEAGTIGERPPGWIVPTKGWRAELTETRAAEGSICARLTKPGESSAPFGNLMRLIEAQDLQGRRVKLSAQILVEGAGGRAQMWFRVDRSNDQIGAFDNMDDRPILPGDWTEAVIEAVVDADASDLAIGFMSFQGATLFIDSVKLEVGDKVALQSPSAPRSLTKRGMRNVAATTRLLSYVRFFHPSDQAAAVRAWDHFAVHAIEETEPAADARDLAIRLHRTFAPLAPTLVVWVGGPDQAPPIPPAPVGATGMAHWRHNGAGTIGRKNARSAYSSTITREPISAVPEGQSLAAGYVVKPLGGGVTCRLPIKVFYDGEGTLPHAATETPWTAGKDLPKLTALNRSTRLAGVALCWGVMQHFYPYFDVVKTDWDEALSASLKESAVNIDERAYLHTLQALVARLHDGHGDVWNTAVASGDMLSVALAWAGKDLVIVGTHARTPSDVAVGDVILSIDGRSTEACYKEVSRTISAATEGWRRCVAQWYLAGSFPTGDPARLRLRRPDGTEYETALPRIGRDEIADVTSKRPENGSEPSPGIVYFDLNDAGTEALSAVLSKLQAARGIVFDLRGYPGGAAKELLHYLIGEAGQSARWNIPIVTLPDHEGWTEWNTSGRWPLEPKSPRLTGHVAFLTDGRAISYAESIMGIVEAYKLGEIVGAATAGTNGNVNPFALPGGYTVVWTGMKVLKHDGSQHHGVGIHPTIPVEPTSKGIAEGRDEVLERAVEVLSARISAEPAP